MKRYKKDHEAIFGSNNENIVQDFDDIFKKYKLIEIDQLTVNAMFNVFCQGILNVMNPNSSFNKKYKIKAGK